MPCWAPIAEAFREIQPYDFYKSLVWKATTWCIFFHPPHLYCGWRRFMNDRTNEMLSRNKLLSINSCCHFLYLRWTVTRSTDWQKKFANASSQDRILPRSLSCTLHTGTWFVSCEIKYRQCIFKNSMFIRFYISHLTIPKLCTMMLFTLPPDSLSQTLHFLFSKQKEQVVTSPKQSINTTP